MSVTLNFTEFTNIIKPVCNDGVVDAWMERDDVLLDTEDEREVDDNQMHKVRNFVRDSSCESVNYDAAFDDDQGDVNDTKESCSYDVLLDTSLDKEFVRKVLFSHGVILPDNLNDPPSCTKPYVRPKQVPEEQNHTSTQALDDEDDDDSEVEPTAVVTNRDQVYAPEEHIDDGREDANSSDDEHIFDDVGGDVEDNCDNDEDGDLSGVSDNDEIQDGLLAQLQSMSDISENHVDQTQNLEDDSNDADNARQMEGTIQKANTNVLKCDKSTQFPPLDEKNTIFRELCTKYQRQRRENGELGLVPKFCVDPNEHQSPLQDRDRGDEEEIGSVHTSEDEESTHNTEDEESARNSEDEESARNSEDEEAVRNSEDEESVRNSEDEESVRSSEDEESVRSSEDEESARNSEDDESAHNSVTGESAHYSEDEESAQSSEDGESTLSAVAEESAQSSEDGESILSAVAEESAQSSEDGESILSAVAEESAQSSEDGESILSAVAEESAQSSEDGESILSAVAEESAPSSDDRESSHNSVFRESAQSFDDLKTGHISDTGESAQSSNNGVSAHTSNDGIPANTPEDEGAAPTSENGECRARVYKRARFKRHGRIYRRLCSDQENIQTNQLPSAHPSLSESFNENLRDGEGVAEKVESESGQAEEPSCQFNEQLPSNSARVRLPPQKMEIPEHFRLRASQRSANVDEYIYKNYPQIIARALEMIAAEEKICKIKRGRNVHLYARVIAYLDLFEDGIVTLVDYMNNEEGLEAALEETEYNFAHPEAVGMGMKGNSGEDNNQAKEDELASSVDDANKKVVEDELDSQENAIEEFLPESECSIEMSSESETDSVSIHDNDIPEITCAREEKTWERRRRAYQRHGLYGLSPELLNRQPGLDNPYESQFRKSHTVKNGIVWQLICQGHQNRLIVEDIPETRRKYLGAMCYVLIKTFIDEEYAEKQEKVDIFRLNNRFITFELPYIPIKSSPFRVYRICIELVVLKPKIMIHNLSDRNLKAADVTLISLDGCKLYSHSQLLSLCSPKLATMMEDRCEKSNQIKTIDVNASTEALVAFLRLLYGESFEINLKEMEEVLDLAKFYESDFHLKRLEKYLLNFKHTKLAFCYSITHSLHHLFNECLPLWPKLQGGAGRARLTTNNNNEIVLYPAPPLRPVFTSLSALFARVPTPEPQVLPRIGYPFTITYHICNISEFAEGATLRSPGQHDECNKIEWFIRVKRDKHRIFAQIRCEGKTKSLENYKIIPEYKDNITFYEIAVDSITNDVITVKFTVNSVKIRLDMKTFMTMDFKSKSLKGSDLKIKFKDKYLYCHSQLLRMHSKILNAHLADLAEDDEETDTNHSVVQFDDVSYPVMKLALSILYDFCLWKSNLHNNRIFSLMEPLLDFAKKYEITRITDTVEFMFMCSGLYNISPIIVWKYDFQICKKFLKVQFQHKPEMQSMLVKLIKRKEYLALSTSLQRELNNTLNDRIPMF